MITRSQDWKNALADAVRDPAELLALLELPQQLLPAARAAAALFPLRVPRGFIARMGRGDPNDPLLRQVLPLGEELAPIPGFTTDPVGDLDATALPGVLHKYRNRTLLVATGACAIHCRYCFRRHFPYGEATAAKQQWQAALDYIAADDTIEEVILSGGDPLLLDDARLESLVGGLERIRHVQRLRLHSRVPVVLPERIDDALLGWLRRSRLQPVVVIHANHPRELDDTVARALAPLRATGTTLLNQTVLLRGVNDDTDILRQLSVRLHQLGVLPYYLHLLDRVTGAAHFDVPEPRAMALWETLRRQLPGYLVPRLARERAGAPYKLQPSAISQPT